MLQTFTKPVLLTYVLEKMIHPFVIVVLLVSIHSASQAQQAELISLDKLQGMISAKGESVQIFNFWATWCAPCVKELPLFEKLNQERKDINITLVSMDFDLDPNPEKVYKFMSRKSIQSRVVILNAKDPNAYIDKIDKNWSGALPTTLIINPATGKRKLVQKELHEGDLEKFIEEVK